MMGGRQAGGERVVSGRRAGDGWAKGIKSLYMSNFGFTYSDCFYIKYK